MNVSDWVLIGTTLFLGATALLVPVLSEYVKRKAFAPKIEILFDLTPPFCVKTYWRSSSDPNLNEPVFYFRLQLFNNGKSLARQCEAVLEELWIYDVSGTPRRYPNFSAVNLRIEGGTPQLPQFVNVNPHRRVFCAFGHLSSPPYQAKEEKKFLIDVPGKHEDVLRFLFDQIVYPFGQPNCLVPGKYVIKVTVYSENALPQTIFLQIHWSGVWQESEPDIHRELVIHKVQSII